MTSLGERYKYVGVLVVTALCVRQPSFCTSTPAVTLTPNNARFSGPTRVCPSGNLDSFSRFFTAHPYAGLT